MRITREELLKWYDARSVLLGLNPMAQDMTEGMKLAKECDHEDAKWLTSLFPDGAPRSEEDARAMFLAEGETAKALCFAGLVAGAEWELIDRSAEYGNPLAMAVMAQWCNGDKRLGWAEKSAARGEPEGLYVLAWCLCPGGSNRETMARALQLWKEAADMGHALSQFELGKRGFGESDIERYVLWGKAAARGEQNAVSSLLRSVEKQVQMGSCKIVVEIGAACRGLVNSQPMKVFGKRVDKNVFDAVDRAVTIFSEWSANRAIWFWIWAAKRELGVAKDMRVLIATMVWEERGEWRQGRK